MRPRIKGYRIVLELDSSAPFLDYTGLVTKTLVYTLVPELLVMKSVKGVLSPIHVSPLFTVSGDHDLGDLVTVRVSVDENGDYTVEPVELNGEYVFHIGGEEGLVDKIAKELVNLGSKIAIKIGGSIIKYKIEKAVDITNETVEKAESINDKVRVYLKSPAQIFNVFTQGKLPKFTPTAVELLMTPYAIVMNQYTITGQLVTSSFNVLGRLVETWYSLKTLVPVRVFIKGRTQFHLAGHVTYIIDGKIRGELRELLVNVLAAAELSGIGRSRRNGFGTSIITV